MPLVTSVKFECPKCYPPIYFKNTEGKINHMTRGKHRGEERRKRRDRIACSVYKK